MNSAVFGNYRSIDSYWDVVLEYSTLSIIDITQPLFFAQYPRRSQLLRAQPIVRPLCEPMQSRSACSLFTEIPDKYTLMPNRWYPLTIMNSRNIINVQANMRRAVLGPSNVARYCHYRRVLHYRETLRYIIAKFC